MKKLLILLFSFFLLGSPSVFADDISDFQIEGMSIGDSLLDYMTKDEIHEEIERNINDYYYLNEPKKYIGIYLWKEFPTYDFVSVFIKNNATNQYLTNKNEKYTILSVRGYISYEEDFDNCIQKRDEVEAVISEMFPNSNITENRVIFPGDPSGKSIKEDILFEFFTGEHVEVSCTNMDESYRTKNNRTEGFGIIVRSKEIISWLSDY